jgi:hypothetical protein
MTTGDKQRLFMKLLGEFLVWLYKEGYEVTGGELQRSEEQAKANAASGSGIARSLHLIRLAIDLNLFINGAYQSDSAAYAPLGAKWKSMHPLCRWGGDFKDAQGRPKPDGNHFSLEHEGRK